MNIETRADYHIHATTLENSISLVEKAKRVGVTSLAVIGRGTLPPGVEESREEARRAEIEISYGVEDVFSIQGERHDFIVFDIDPIDAEIQKFYGREATKKASLAVLNKQINFLREQGFVVEGYDEESNLLYKHLKAGKTYEKAIELCRLINQNPQNSKLAKKTWGKFGRNFAKQYCNSTYDLTNHSPKFFWWLYFSVGQPGYFHTEYDIEEVAKITHAAGGKFLFSPESDDPDEEAMCVLPDRDYIDGVMGWHGSRLALNRDTITWLRKNGKIILGGSDYNPLRDGEKNQWLIGIGQGDMYISPIRLRREYEWADRIHLNEQIELASS